MIKHVIKTVRLHLCWMKVFADGITNKFLFKTIRKQFSFVESTKICISFANRCNVHCLIWRIHAIFINGYHDDYALCDVMAIVPKYYIKRYISSLRYSAFGLRHRGNGATSYGIKNPFGYGFIVINLLFQTETNRIMTANQMFRPSW